MDTIGIFTNKAALYASYRWDYAPEAVDKVFDISGLGQQAVVADIGAGTGILTRHFAGRVRKIYAFEPNQAMREEAARRLSDIPVCVVIDAPAESTGLPDQSVDLITVAQAVHWFQAEAARAEFRRILKPGGWLALLHNTSQDDAISAELAAIATPEYGVLPVHPAPSAHIPESYYFEGGSCQAFRFPFRVERSLDQFIGSSLSASFTPDESNPAYPRFVAALRDIFTRHCPGGTSVVNGQTHLIIGQPDSRVD